MKVIALALTTLCLASVTQVSADYTLQCTREEIGIRWPSYFSNSEYYICPRVGGKQLTVTCPKGEVFTFVLQACTAPSKFVPAPLLEFLPTSPVQTPPHLEPSVEELMPEPKPLFPKPIQTSSNDVLVPPPVMPNEKPIHLEQPSPPVAPVIVAEPHQPAEENHQIPDPPSKPLMPALPALPVKPQMPSLPSKKNEGPAAPLPPTPGPTPQVFTGGKKMPPALPGARKKQPPKPAGKKSPPKPTGQKLQPPSA